MNVRMKLFMGLTAVLLLVSLFISQTGRNHRLFAGSDYAIYLPLVTKPVSKDLTVTGVEITQAIQRADNSVPLVANRNTVVRVFAEAPVGGPINNVVVRLTAVRNGSTIGQMNSAPTTIPIDATRDNFNSSVNFQLPAGWLSGNVNLTATIDPDNTVPEANENNNTISQTINFNTVPDLQVRLVPINYTHTGPTAPGFYPAQSVDYISDWLMRAYPVGNVEIAIRSPYNFTGNLQDSNSWVNDLQTGLLNRMRELKLFDGYSLNTPVVYYAFVPISNGSTRWFFSGIAGIGWIGGRESVGLNLMGFWPADETGKLAAHEIGHNMGRRHAPCGVSGQTDPNYPYPGASIGEYGLDIPNGVFWSPATAVDIMSYCEPAWISDYTYIGIYNDQQANGFAAMNDMAVDSLIVSASLSADGAVTLAPSYAFASYPAADGGSDYRVELLDENGNILVSHPMQLREAEEEEVSARELTAVLPLPTTAAATLRLMHGNEVVASRSLSNPAAFGPQTATAVRQGNRITLTWGLVNTPAVVRLSPDGGQNWTALGIDVTDGTFTVDATTLPASENGLFEIILGNTGSKVVLTAVLP
ncbi:MAG: hypothetical protein HND44_10155 [Chloroflexi bacterium]|nr:hypothetical protein [Ardenticatenaceae bacterium]MBL1128841.1 hypothetical protein [Chloroflexota bacterium]NOG34918.1 hypothetical protein [Chloroflexota bacterium]GIK58081.1 MAG: hypothetical protein BroJett015_37440 [Chloroflexota bacterium]